MEVIKPGSWVTIGGDVRAQILSATIDSDLAVGYGVVWWSGRDRKEAFLQAIEVTPAEPPERLTVGFINGNKS